MEVSKDQWEVGTHNWLNRYLIRSKELGREREFLELQQVRADAQCWRDKWCYTMHGCYILMRSSWSTVSSSGHFQEWWGAAKESKEEQ